MDDRQNTRVPARETMTPFDEIYDQPDPRAFFGTLAKFEYQTPHHAQRLFRRMVVARAKAAGTADTVAVLDICCSYGINAALLNYDLTLDDLYAHYVSPESARLTTPELIDRDRTFFAAHRRRDAVPVIGLDIAGNAIAYACAVGLLDKGFAENLEAAAPTPALLDAARSVGLVTITGGASFLSSRTFAPLLADGAAPMWVAAFVLRTSSYQPIADCLATFGLITEKAATPMFRQRRFTDPQERQYAIDSVKAAGEDPRAETDGYFHTALHLSRPAADVTAPPLTDLMRHDCDTQSGAEIVVAQLDERRIGELPATAHGTHGGDQSSLGSPLDEARSRNR